MTGPGRALALLGACVLTVLLLLLAAGPGEPPRAPSDAAPSGATAGDPRTAAPIAAEPAPVTPGPVAGDAPAGKYFFDVHAHSAEEFYALLERARAIYDETPEAARADLEVVLVLHGPDVEFFAAKNYAEHQRIVDLAAQLDAFGVFDFRICAASAASLGLATTDVPAFIEFVPYGPAEIRRLEEAGYAEL